MQNPSAKHQQLVQALLNHFTSKLGYRILGAAYPGFNEPEKHGRHAPDIIAIDQGGVVHLAEAKVGDDIFSEATSQQLTDFSDRIMTTSKAVVPLHIIVYKEDEQRLITRLNDLGLGAKIGSRIKIWTL